MIELFYDLVFAYMIAQASEILHHLQGGVITPATLLAFAFIMVIFINAWMIQSVFTNCFGNSSWADIGFSLLIG